MLLPSGQKLNITPINPSSISSEDDIIKIGREFAEASQKWDHTKDFEKGLVKGYAHAKDADDEEPWFCRVSEHSTDEISFDELWFALGTTKPEHEKKFVTTIDQVVLLKQLSDRAAIWNLHYKFTPPVSNSTFTVLQVTDLDTSGAKKSGVVVSLPVDVSSDDEMAKAETKGARGRYVAVERVQELENGKIEWRMATSSTPGGSIPKFIVHSTTPGQVAHDVPLFFKWYNSDKEYFKNALKSKSDATAVPQAETSA